MAEQKVKREFKLSTISVKNRTTVFIISFVIFLGGVYSYVNMPKESFPELVIPQIYVGVPFPGNSPTDMEEKITEPIEQEINGISGVDKITSTSIQGYATIMIEFDFSVTPTEALRKVKDAVDKIKADPEYPKDAMEPNIFEMNFSEFPIMNINLAADKDDAYKATTEELKEYAEDLEEELEDLDYISKVEIRGSPDKELKINVRPYDLEARKVSFQDIENTIRSHNINLSLGDIKADEYRKTLRVIGKFESVEEIKRIIVKRENQDLVYLEDVADVVFEEEEPSSYAREFGEPVVMLDVIKRSGQNLLEATDTIFKILAHYETSGKLDGAVYTVTNDQSTVTRNMVNNLENSIILGVILVTLTLVFFLGLRNALFVGVAIPMSMFMAFMILGTLGITLNMMTLFSLILALGMLVDNGIVVVENIYRLRDEGMKPIKAAIHGVGEVALAIIASTATTLAAFLPLAFWPGMMGEFMQYLPITLIIVLGSSLFVGLVINPVLTAAFMKLKEDELKTSRKRLVIAFILLLMGSMMMTQSAMGAVPFLIGLVMILGKYLFVNRTTSFKVLLPPVVILGVVAIANFVMGSIGTGNVIGAVTALILANYYLLNPGAELFQKKTLPWMESKYQVFLAGALRGRRPTWFLVGTLGLLFLSFVLMGAFTPKVVFFPEGAPNYVNVFIEKPIGSDIDATDKVAQEVEQIVMELMEEYEIVMTDENGREYMDNFLVSSIITQVGDGTSDPNQPPTSLGNTPHLARVTVSFVEYEKRYDPRIGGFINTAQVLQDIRDAVKHVPGAWITVDKDQQGPPQQKPVNIEVRGDDYELCFQYADSLKQFFDAKNINGYERITLDVENTKPEIIIDIDEEAAEQYDINNYQIASTIRTALFGNEVTSYSYNNEDYEIQIRLVDEYRYNLDALLDQRITFRNPSNGRIVQVPISSVASIRESQTFSAIKRKNLDRMVTLFSNVNTDANANEVVQTLKDSIAGFKYPANLDIVFTGEMEDQAKEMAFLSKALLIAFCLIIIIIVMQFNAVSVPFIVGGSVVFSLIGVLLGLVIFQMNFIVIMTMLGIISLAGIVVNNAIVLIDYINLLIQRRMAELGLDEDGRLPIEDVIGCVIEGGKTRLRPVLLTAITTVLGLLPMAAGMNINFFTLFSEFNANIYFGGDNAMFWGSLSTTVIFGLTFATFLTLVIVPVMFLIIRKIKYKVVKVKQASL